MQRPHHHRPWHILSFALFGAAFVSTAAIAQDAPPREPSSCVSDADCADGEACVLPDCERCDPADPICEPNDCLGSGTCEAIPEPPGECTTDADCGEGAFCALFDCAAPCDPDDETCEPTDCAGGGVCITDDPPELACSTDDDCDAGEVCFTQTYEVCGGFGCECEPEDPACDCAPPAPDECESFTESICAPRYVAPCEADADCGEGFTCEQLASCTCSDGGPTSGGGTDGEPGAPEEDAAPPACECEVPEDVGVCVLVRTECTDDDDCPIDGFKCVDEGSAAPCSVDNEGNVECGEPTTDLICAPADFQGGGVERGEETSAGEGEGEPNDGDDTLGDDVDARNVFVIDCSQGSASGAWPFASLLVGLAALRRRRR